MPTAFFGIEPGAMYDEEKDEDFFWRCVTHVTTALRGAFPGVDCVVLSTDDTDEGCPSNAEVDAVGRKAVAAFVAAHVAK